MKILLQDDAEEEEGVPAAPAPVIGEEDEGLLLNHVVGKQHDVHC